MERGLGHRLRVRTSATLRSLNLSRGTAIGLLGAIVVVVGGLVVFATSVADVVRHDGPVAADLSNLQWFTSHRTASSVDVARTLGDVIGPMSLAVVALGAGAILWWNRQRLYVALVPFVSLAVAGSTASVVKVWVGRDRPPATMQVVAESTSSFPSRHLAEVTALVLALALVVSVFVLSRWAARVLVLALAVELVVAVGVSRLVLGVHWPLDVVAGATLGLVVAVSTTIGAVMIDAGTPGDWPADRMPLLWRTLNLRRRGPALRVGRFEPGE